MAKMRERRKFPMALSPVSTLLSMVLQKQTYTHQKRPNSKTKTKKHSSNATLFTCKKINLFQWKSRFLFLNFFYNFQSLLKIALHQRTNMPKMLEGAMSCKTNYIHNIKTNKQKNLYTNIIRNSVTNFTLKSSLPLL